MKLLAKIALGLVVLVFSSACQNPANSTTTNTSKDPVLLFSDNFLKSQQWYVNSTTQRTFAYVADGYEISTGMASSWWWSSCPYTNDNSFNSPYIVEWTGKATLADQTKNGGFGLVFDITDSNNFCWVTFDKAGKFLVNKLVGGSAVKPPVIDWTPASSFGVGSLNTIKLKHDQNSIELFVNGVSVAKSSSFTIPGPVKLNLLVDNFGTTSTTAHFTDFKLYKQ